MKKKNISQETTSGRKKKHAAKDPSAPKKPMSVYILWLQDNRAMIKQRHPGLSMAEIAKKAGELWRELEEEDKAVRSYLCISVCGLGTRLSWHSLIPRPPLYLVA